MKMKLAPLTAVVRLGWALVFTGSQVIFAHAAEKNFWEQRRRAAETRGYRTPSGITAAEEPAGDVAQMRAEAARNSQIVTQGLPAPASVNPVLFNRELLKDLPATQKNEDWAPWLSLLSQEGTVRGIQWAKGKPEGAPWVIYVQDVHGHKEAQKNIAGMILKVLEKNPTTLVSLEGAAGDIDMEPLRSGDAEADKITGGLFLEAGMIGGPEFAAFSAPVAPRLFGMEKEELYIKHVEAVEESLPQQPALLQALKTWETRLNAEKEKAYSPALKSLDEKMAARQAGTLSLGDYLTYLTEGTPELKNYPNLQLYHQAWEIETDLDFRAVEEERNSALRTMVANLPKSDIDKFLQTGVAFRLGQISYTEFYAFLKTMGNRAKLDWGRYPQFEKYIRYIAQADAIKPEALIKEVAQIEKQAARRRIQNNVQRRVFEEASDLRLLFKLATLSLTTDEWAEYRARQNDIHRLYNATFNEDSKKEFEMRLVDHAVILAPFERFYILAESRNESLSDTFLEKALPASKTAPARPAPADKLAPETYEEESAPTQSGGHPPLAILVAGGFHGTGLTQLLTKRGVTVVTVSPKFSVSSAGLSDNDYLHSFTRDRTPLEKMFSSPKISINVTPAVKPIDGRNPAAAFVQKMAVLIARAVREAKAKGWARVTRRADNSRAVCLVTQDAGPREAPALRGEPVFKQSYGGYTATIYRTSLGWAGQFLSFVSGLGQRITAPAAEPVPPGAALSMRSSEELRPAWVNPRLWRTTITPFLEIGWFARLLWAYLFSPNGLARALLGVDRYQNLGSGYYRELLKFFVGSKMHSDRVFEYERYVGTHRIVVAMATVVGVIFVSFLLAALGILFSGIQPPYVSAFLQLHNSIVALFGEGNRTMLLFVQSVASFLVAPLLILVGWYYSLHGGWNFFHPAGGFLSADAGVSPDIEAEVFAILSNQLKLPVDALKQMVKFWEEGRRLAASDASTAELLAEHEKIQTSSPAPSFSHQYAIALRHALRRRGQAPAEPGLQERAFSAEQAAVVGAGRYRISFQVNAKNEVVVRIFDGATGQSELAPALRIPLSRMFVSGNHRVWLQMLPDLAPFSVKIDDTDKPGAYRLVLVEPTAAARAVTTPPLAELPAANPALEAAFEAAAGAARNAVEALRAGKTSLQREQHEQFEREYTEIFERYRAAVGPLLEMGILSKGNQHVSLVNEVARKLNFLATSIENYGENRAWLATTLENLNNQKDMTRFQQVKLAIKKDWAELATTVGEQLQARFDKLSTDLADIALRMEEGEAVSSDLVAAADRVDNFRKTLAAVHDLAMVRNRYPHLNLYAHLNLDVGASLEAVLLVAKNPPDHKWSKKAAELLSNPLAKQFYDEIWSVKNMRTMERDQADDKSWSRARYTAYKNRSRRVEDFVMRDPRGRYLMLSDGMGGHADGAKASQSAVNGAWKIIEPSDFESKETAQEVVTILNDAVLSARQEVAAQSGPSEMDEMPMGATLVIPLFWRNPQNGKMTLIAANVGDSRLYVLTAGGALHQISQDDAEKGSGLLNDAIGAGVSVDQSLKPHQLIVRELNPGDMVMVASDGVYTNLKSRLEAAVEKARASDNPAQSLVEDAADVAWSSSPDQKTDDLSVAVMFAPVAQPAPPAATPAQPAAAAPAQPAAVAPVQPAAPLPLPLPAPAVPEIQIPAAAPAVPPANPVTDQRERAFGLVNVGDAFRFVEGDIRVIYANKREGYFIIADLNKNTCSLMPVGEVVMGILSQTLTWRKEQKTPDIAGLESLMDRALNAGLRPGPGFLGTYIWELESRLDEIEPLIKDRLVIVKGFPPSVQPDPFYRIEFAQYAYCKNYWTVQARKFNTEIFSAPCSFETAVQEGINAKKGTLYSIDMKDTFLSPMGEGEVLAIREGQVDIRLSNGTEQARPLAKVKEMFGLDDKPTTLQNIAEQWAAQRWGGESARYRVFAVLGTAWEMFYQLPGLMAHVRPLLAFANRKGWMPAGFVETIREPRGAALAGWAGTFSFTVGLLLGSSLSMGIGLLVSSAISGYLFSGAHKNKTPAGYFVSGVVGFFLALAIGTPVMLARAGVIPFEAIALGPVLNVALHAAINGLALLRGTAPAVAPRPAGRVWRALNDVAAAPFRFVQASRTSFARLSIVFTQTGLLLIASWTLAVSALQAANTRYVLTREAGVRSLVLEAGHPASVQKILASIQTLDVSAESKEQMADWAQALAGQLQTHVLESYDAAVGRRSSPAAAQSLSDVYWTILDLQFQRQWNEIRDTPRPTKAAFLKFVALAHSVKERPRAIQAPFLSTDALMDLARAKNLEIDRSEMGHISSGLVFNAFSRRLQEAKVRAEKQSAAGRWLSNAQRSLSSLVHISEGTAYAYFAEKPDTDTAANLKARAEDFAKVEARRSGALGLIFRLKDSVAPQLRRRDTLFTVSQNISETETREDLAKALVAQGLSETAADNYLKSVVWIDMNQSAKTPAGGKFSLSQVAEAVRRSATAVSAGVTRPPFVIVRLSNVDVLSYSPYDIANPAYALELIVKNLGAIVNPYKEMLNAIEAVQAAAKSA